MIQTTHTVRVPGGGLTQWQSFSQMRAARSAFLSYSVREQGSRWTHESAGIKPEVIARLTAIQQEVKESAGNISDSGLSMIERVAMEESAKIEATEKKRQPKGKVHLITTDGRVACGVGEPIDLLCSGQVGDVTCKRCQKSLQVNPRSRGYA